jgi:uncharacterized protein (DUF1778 family)
MLSKARKTEKLDLRLSLQAKRVLAAAAEVDGRSVSDFVLESALSRAEERLADRHAFVLSAEKWNELVALLDAPPEPMPELARRLRQRAPWE